jgi:hypothetical protein
MFYRLEIKEKMFGTVTFRSIEEATVYLRELFKRADDRYLRAVSAKNFRVANAIRQVKETVFKDVQIVSVSVEAATGPQSELRKSSGPSPHSSCRRSYSQVV